MKIYLDNCCFNRPFDDQSNIMVRLESEAKLFVQDLILKKQLALIWSFILDYENKDNPFEERRQRIAEWKNLSCVHCVLNSNIQQQAKMLMETGLKQKDSAHIACAIDAKADYFLTTDKKILNKPILNICVLNPIEFVRRYVDEQ
jgi:predicted nucleic acid-binding protein